jgi:hypothetical protein
MKKLLVLAVCTGAVATALAQVGTVNFTTLVPGSVDAAVTDAGGALLNGADGYVAQLAYTATEGGALTPFGSVSAFFSAAPAGYGYVVAGSQSLAGMAGADVWIQMQAWNSNDGASLADAMAAGGMAGVSNIIPVTLGGGGDPPAVPADLVGLQGFQLQGGEVIPEPSTFALGLIGIGALLLRRRK